MRAAGQSSFTRVWVVVTLRHGRLPLCARESIEEARRIADARSTGVLAVIVDGREADDAVRDAAFHGAVEIALLDSSESVTPKVVADLVADRIAKAAPEVVLFAGTARGVDLGARIGAILGQRFAERCIDVDLSPEHALGTTVTVMRSVPDGRRHRRQQWSARPALLAMLPGALGCGADRPYEVDPAVQLWPVSADSDARAGILRTSGEAGQQTLPDCDIIVAAGAGIGGQDGVARVRELADLIGAGVAASRPAIDAGWLPGTQKVGLTGFSVTPRVYIACGISGASQHLAGIRSAESVIAINSDPSAPMVARADLAIIGDAAAIVPEISRQIRERRLALHHEESAR